MSRFDTRDIACPHCGHVQALDIATSLNITNSPHFKDEIVAGRFQHFACGACGKGFGVDSPLAYIDFGVRRWIYLFPAAWETHWPELEQEPREAFDNYMTGQYSSPIARAMAGGFTLRAVFGMPALAEKILCAGHGIDDALLEAFKLHMTMSRPDMALHRAALPRLFAVDEAELLFTEPAKGSDRAMALPRRGFEAFCADTAPYGALLTALRQGPYVDLGRIVTG
jgi:hypothetical protein